MTETYTLAKTAALFKTTPSKIKARCAKGDFDYTVDERGWHITTESILKHLPELELKNNAPTTAGDVPSKHAPRGSATRYPRRTDQGRWLR